MSDTPGGNSHPRDRRRKERFRKRNRRPAQQTGGPSESPPPRDNRENRGPRRRRDRDRNRPRREKESRTAPAAGRKPTLGQKLLCILTFGLVRPKSASGTAAPPRDKKSPAPQPAMHIPPADPDAVRLPRLHVGNLHYDIEESDLLNLFKGIGPVKSVDVIYNGRTHRSRGWGFVEFISLEDARRAVAELHGLPYMRRPLILGPALARGQDEREADTPDRTE